MATPAHSEDISACPFWREYSGAALGEDIDLTAVEGAPPGRAVRQVMMLEAGVLKAKNRAGIDCSGTTALAAGTTLPVEAATILAAQTAAIMVFW